MTDSPTSQPAAGSVAETTGAAGTAAAAGADSPGARHPALAGREPESAMLADAVRRLIGLCTTTTAPPETTLAAAHAVVAVADMLQPHVPDPPLPKPMSPPGAGDTDLAGRMPYDVIVGRHNPISLPLDLSFEPPKALLRGGFTKPYEGPPNCVHGAVLAASFDIVLAAANFISGIAGPTAKLEIAYRRPTALYEPCLFEGWVESREGNRVRTVGRLLQGDRVTVEASGDFVALDMAEIARMQERAGAGNGSAR